MRITEPDRPCSARELADGMRSGLETRRFFTVAAPVPEPVTQHLPAAEFLLPLANLQGHPPVTTPGPFAVAVQLVRRVVKRLLHPWLGFQTGFNAAAVRVLDQHDHRLAQASERTHHLEERIAELSRLLQRLHGRLNECHLALDQERHRRVALEARLASLEPSSTTALALHHPKDDPATLVSEHILLNVFLQTRLPAPPARLLVLSDDPEAGSDLVALGYPVVTAPPAAPLHFADNAFDAIVLHTMTGVSEDVIAEAGRLLPEHGRLVALLPMAQAHLPGAWSIVETAFAVRRGGDWSLSIDPTGGTLALLTREKAGS